MWLAVKVNCPAPKPQWILHVVNLPQSTFTATVKRGFSFPGCSLQSTIVPHLMLEPRFSSLFWLFQALFCLVLKSHVCYVKLVKTPTKENIMLLWGHWVLLWIINYSNFVLSLPHQSKHLSLWHQNINSLHTFKSSVFLSSHLTF